MNNYYKFKGVKYKFDKILLYGRTRVRIGFLEASGSDFLKGRWWGGYPAICIIYIIKNRKV